MDFFRRLLSRHSGSRFEGEKAEAPPKAWRRALKIKPFNRATNLATQTTTPVASEGPPATVPQRGALSPIPSLRSIEQLPNALSSPCISDLTEPLSPPVSLVAFQTPRDGHVATSSATAELSCVGCHAFLQLTVSLTTPPHPRVSRSCLPFAHEPTPISTPPPAHSGSFLLASTGLGICEGLDRTPNDLDPSNDTPSIPATPRPVILGLPEVSPGTSVPLSPNSTRGAYADHLPPVETGDNGRIDGLSRAEPLASPTPTGKYNDDIPPFKCRENLLSEEADLQHLLTTVDHDGGEARNRAEAAVANDSCVQFIGPKLAARSWTPNQGLSASDGMPAMMLPHTTTRTEAGDASRHVSPSPWLTQVLYGSQQGPVLVSARRRYHLVRRLGKGRNGSIYSAISNAGEDVAVRIIRKVHAYSQDGPGRQGIINATSIMKTISSSACEGRFLMPLLHSWSDDLSIYSVMVRLQHRAPVSHSLITVIAEMSLQPQDVVSFLLHPYVPVQDLRC